jgi:hypothetical protein
MNTSAQRHSSASRLASAAGAAAACALATVPAAALDGSGSAVSRTRAPPVVRCARLAHSSSTPSRRAVSGASAAWVTPIWKKHATQASLDSVVSASHSGRRARCFCFGS